MSLPPPDPSEIRSFLLLAAQTDGPIRLQKPRALPSGDGLLRDRRGGAAQLVARLLGSLLEEAPRCPGQPRRVLLTDRGLRALLETTAPARRPSLAREVAPAYRARLLRTWKEIASPSEQPAFQASCAEHFGDLFAQTSPASPPPTDAATFVRALAKELVLSWERTREPDARRALSRAMLSLGLREIGRAGDTASFTGRLHLAEEPLFQGDPVHIVEPGWIVSDGQGEFLLLKAKVKASPQP